MVAIRKFVVAVYCCGDDNIEMREVYATSEVCAAMGVTQELTGFDYLSYVSDGELLNPGSLEDLQEAFWFYQEGYVSVHEVADE